MKGAEGVGGISVLPELSLFNSRLCLDVLSSWAGLFVQNLGTAPSKWQQNRHGRPEKNLTRHEMKHGGPKSTINEALS